MTSEIILSKCHYDQIIDILLDKKLSRCKKTKKNKIKELFGLEKAPEGSRARGQRERYLEQYCRIEGKCKVKLRYVFDAAQGDAIDSIEDRLALEFRHNSQLYGNESLLMQFFFK